MKREFDSPDESVVVPDCDCPRRPEDHFRHRPGCPRMAAIYRKWHGPEAEQRWLAQAVEQ